MLRRVELRVVIEAFVIPILNISNHQDMLTNLISSLPQMLWNPFGFKVRDPSLA